MTDDSWDEVEMAWMDWIETEHRLPMEIERALDRLKDIAKYGI